MKNNTLKLTLVTIVVTVFFSSTSVYLRMAPTLWREISPSQAAKQSLKIPSWAPLVEKTQPAVVVIKTEALVEQPPMELQGTPGPFRFLLPMPPERQRGQGSGFLINEDGYIVTNQHVIDSAQRIRVTVGTNPREYEAQLVGADELLDLAVLKLKTKDKLRWPFLPLGDSDNLKLADNVMALGSPLGLEQSVTIGTVSHKYRAGMRPSGRALISELVQLQIPINPGNSGGPVVNDSGEVVCVAESISAAGQNIGFCLPINSLKNPIHQLYTTGYIERGFLGVEPTNLTQALAKKFGLSEETTGAVIVQILSNTPAEKAGLLPMDIILEMDGRKIIDKDDLKNQAAKKAVGQNVKLQIFREGVGLKEINVKMERRPGLPVPIIRSDNDLSSTIVIESVGMEVIDTTNEVQQELRLPATNTGAKITLIKPGSSASFAKLEVGDVITKFDGINIMSATQLKSLLDNAKRDTIYIMMTRRGSYDRFVEFIKH